MPRTAETVPTVDLVAHRAEQLAVERVRRGDPLALEMIFTAFRGELLQLARERTGSDAVAEDVVQDVFLAIWAGRATWHIRSSLRAYLRRAVHNVAARARTSSTRGPGTGLSLDAPETAAVSDLADPSPAPDEFVQHAALADALVRATRELPPRVRDVFALSRAHDLSNREIATTLGISLKTVETHMTRALVFLRRRLAAWRA